MKIKSYGIATPSFNVSNKLYQVKAILTGAKTKVYGLRLNVVSPFIEKEKDYPLKAMTTERHLAYTDDRVSEVATRIRTVDTVLSKYLLGDRRDEKGANVLEGGYLGSRSELTASVAESSEFSTDSITYAIDILESQATTRQDVRDMEILKEFLFNRANNNRTSHLLTSDTFKPVDVEYSVDILENESALKLLAILNGHSYVENLKSTLVKKVKDANVLEMEVARIIENIYYGRFEEFQDFQIGGIPSYMPDLIDVERVTLERDVRYHSYETIDRAFNPIESRMFDIEFHNRVVAEHHFATVFNDYDYATKPTVHDSSWYHDYYELADRAKLVRDVRYSEYDFGMRSKHLHAIGEGRLFADYTETVRVHLERLISNLTYEQATKPRVVASVYDDGYDYAVHNMLFQSKIDDGFDVAQHNMTRSSIFDGGFDYGTKDGILHDGQYEDFDIFHGDGVDTYMPEIDWFDRVLLEGDKDLDGFELVDRVQLKDSEFIDAPELVDRYNTLDTSMDEITWVDRSDEHLTTSSEYDYFTRIEQDVLLESIETARRSDVILSYLEKVIHVDRALYRDSRMLEIDTSMRVDTFESRDSFYFELVTRFDTFETYAPELDESDRVLFNLPAYLPDFELANLGNEWFGVMPELDEFNLLNDYKAGSYEEFEETLPDAILAVIPDFDLADRLNEFHGTQGDLDEATYQDTKDVVLNEYDLFDRNMVWRSSLEVIDSTSRADIWLSTLEGIDEALRDDVWSTVIEQMDDFHRIDVWDIEVIKDFTGYRVDEWNMEVITDFTGYRDDIRDMEVIEDLPALGGQDYIMDIIEDFPFIRVDDDNTIEIIETFDFLLVNDGHAIQVIEDFPTSGVILDRSITIVEFFEGFLDVIKEGTVDEVTDGASEEFPAYLPEYDLGVRDDTHDTEVQDSFEFDRVLREGAPIVEIFDAVRDSLHGMEIVDIFNAGIDNLFHTIISTIDGADRVIDFAMNITDEFQFDRIQDTLGVIEDSFEFDRLNGRDTIITKEFLADHASMYNTDIEDTFQFSRVQLDATNDEDIHWFTTVVKDMGIDDIDWFNLVVKDAVIEELDWFTRVAVDTVIEDISWFERTAVDTRIIETVAAERNMVYESDVEESEGFDEPEQKEYTWLWHSRPYWWFGWNWKKTK